ncbi:hypothetical protein SAMD00019534_044170 [Acytostelium subglobosum LB1]|uniref:hypothetical protein n=1 Tax=Acytostelium subglobosum LB1 TaxID=1410327 RepID=UPI000644D011|nr:hypothetical protein SAMD00019534_044170 [Acytostelium subglobosum LB1]GAM21242.1 hypothetical protein SAMD00019534_044170 [Acytostelium subglobosum LB1]|eukprot:XP_012755361.1 hypothetical protein SAMD00019534_044170 [Acytostelium subglobosum LB1]
MSSIFDEHRLDIMQGLKAAKPLTSMLSQQGMNVPLSAAAGFELVDDSIVPSTSTTLTTTLTDTQPPFIYALPNEVLEVVMKNFESSDICSNISPISRHFHQLAKSKSLWQHLCIKDFRISKNINNILRDSVDWRREYIGMYRTLSEMCFTPLYLSDESSLKLDRLQQARLHSHPYANRYAPITILNTRRSKPDSTLFIQSRKKVAPLPYGNFNYAYFEITLIAAGVDQNVFIGYSTSCETNDKKQVLKSAVSYHGGDGGMYPNPVMGKEISDPWECNDTAGCGIDFINKHIFFTKNGVLIGKTTPSLSINRLYATIGTISYGDKFSINFGNRPFEFDLVQHQKEARSPLKYPLYSMATTMCERYLCEFFDDVHSKYLDEEMNKITTPVNKEIAYLSNFDEYPNTDRIMKNKIHKYCHQIGQQINGGFTISPEDQTNIAELRRGLAWYWVATKQHHLLLHFVRSSMQSTDIDLKYSPTIELVPMPGDDITFLEELAKRRMAKEIGVLLQSNLDVAHPFVTSVIRHAAASVQRFEQNIVEEQRAIYVEFEQMLQAAEQTDQRMFLALSLSIIIQTKEIIKNNRARKERRIKFMRKEKDMKRQEMEHLNNIGVNLESLLECNMEISSFVVPPGGEQASQPHAAPEIVVMENNGGNGGSSSIGGSNSSNNSINVNELQNDLINNNGNSILEELENFEMTEYQKSRNRLHYLERCLGTLKQEIRVLSEPMSEAAIDIIVWTYLRLSLNIKTNQDIVISKKSVVETLMAEHNKIENEIKKLENEIKKLEVIRLERATRRNSQLSFVDSILTANNQPDSLMASSSNGGDISINIHDEAASSSSSSSSSGSSVHTGSPGSSIQEISVDSSSEDVLSPLWINKRKNRLLPNRRSVVAATVIIFSFVVILLIILLSVLLSER